MPVNRRTFLKSFGYGSAATLATQWGWLRSASKAAEMTSMPITMQLDWVFNVQFAGLLLADHLGLYQQQGLEVSLKPWESGIIVPDRVAATPMMIGCSEQNLISEAQAKGMPLKAIATMLQASPYALMCLPDSGVKSLEDLVGKKVGIHNDGIKVMELVQGVNNLQADAIEVIEISHENKLDRLISGEFDAVQCYAVDEPIGFAQQVGQPPILLPMDQYGYKAYGQVFFTTDMMLEQHPNQVKAFLEASFEGWKRALADIPGTGKLVAESYAESNSKYTDVAYQQKSLALVGDYVRRGISEAKIGTIDPGQWQQANELMARYGIIEGSPDSEAALDLSLWQGLSEV